MPQRNTHADVFNVARGINLGGLGDGLCKFLQKIFVGATLVGTYYFQCDFTEGIYAEK